MYERLCRISPSLPWVMQYECISNVLSKTVISDRGGFKVLYISVIKMPLGDNMLMKLMCVYLNVCVGECWLCIVGQPTVHVPLGLFHLGGWLRAVQDIKVLAVTWLKCTCVVWIPQKPQATHGVCALCEKVSVITLSCFIPVMVSPWE